jgi:hypothetical protein
MIEATELATSIVGVTSCVAASLLSSGKLCEKPLSFELQSLRASHQP